MQHRYRHRCRCRCRCRRLTTADSHGCVAPTISISMQTGMSMSCLERCVTCLKPFTTVATHPQHCVSTLCRPRPPLSQSTTTWECVGPCHASEDSHPLVTESHPIAVMQTHTAVPSAQRTWITTLATPTRPLCTLSSITPTSSLTRHDLRAPTCPSLPIARRAHDPHGALSATTECLDSHRDRDRDTLGRDLLIILLFLLFLQLLFLQPFLRVSTNINVNTNINILLTRCTSHLSTTRPVPLLRGASAALHLHLDLDLIMVLVTASWRRVSQVSLRRGSQSQSRSQSRSQSQR